MQKRHTERRERQLLLVVETEGHHLRDIAMRSKGVHEIIETLLLSTRRRLVKINTARTNGPPSFRKHLLATQGLGTLSF